MKMFKKIETLEFEVLELPRPDAVLFLYMPQEYALKLKQSRAVDETLDQNESSLEHLKAAEETYLLMTETFGFSKIDCVANQEVRSIDEIHKDVYQTVANLIK